ncbi:MAG: dolichyl-phosphate-mannose-protein mannosyltransferase [Cryptosporangiaceae bacterium]|nr:dolichyl-phosphate-mannose-protein mannosyltransferase [Cryptosporangiaceae bacterium]
MAVTFSEHAPPADPSAPAAPPALRHRLASRLPGDRVSSWWWALSIAAAALVLRLVSLSFPSKRVFDEVYYSKDAWSLLQHGVEFNDKGTEGSFVVHPPLGKWCIALGQWIFGNNSLGWRVSAAVFGAVSVLILVRVGRRLLGSTLLGCLAGLLLSLDGLHFVMSRVALLDIFLMTFVLASFACLVLDRDARRATILARLDAGDDPVAAIRRWSGWRHMPWWRIAAALLMGCALAVKWSAVYYLAAFVLLAFVWEAGAVRTAGVKQWIARSIIWEVALAVGFCVLASIVYFGSWSGWLLTDKGWDRHWAENTGSQVAFLPNFVVNLWHYHSAVLDFHENLHTPHPYQSTPWSWLYLGRPVAFYYESPQGCGAPSCSSEIIALGNPVLWWAFLPALAGTAWRWIARRDWAAGAILVGTAAGILPWLAYPGRTMFFFYALPALPFMVLAVTVVLGMVLGKANAELDRRMAGAILVGAYLLLVAGAFAFFYPIYTGELITNAQWQARMWLDTWV